MSKRTKKDLIYFLIGLFITFAICFVIFDFIIENDAGVKSYNTEKMSFKEQIRIFLAIDGCLDDGGCWDYIRNRCEINDQGYCVRNEQDCINRKGLWQKDTKYCVLKDK